VKPAEPRILLWTFAALVGEYLVLRFGVPRLAVWSGLTDYPAPVPAFAMAMYMVCGAVGALVYVSADDRRWREFRMPVVRLFRLDPGPGHRRRLAVLAAVPLVAGWVAWQRVMPGPRVPTVVRLQHPTLPEAYAPMANPFDSPTPDGLREGVVLYQKNCRPCHGAVANGNGPLARGLRLRPVDFTDGGTIASVVAAYPFWRIREGHRTLPPIATPWNSAMPSWGTQLDDDEIWRIVSAEYHIAGTEPRRPERSNR